MGDQNKSSVYTTNVCENIDNLFLFKNEYKRVI